MEMSTRGHIPLIAFRELQSPKVLKSICVPPASYPSLETKQTGAPLTSDHVTSVLQKGIKYKTNCIA